MVTSYIFIISLALTMLLVRELNIIRNADYIIHSNAMMTERMIRQYAEPDAASLDMLRMAMERLKLTARTYSRILKVARTIANLAGIEKVESMHRI